MSQELFEKRKKLICELLEDEMYVPLKEKELAAFMQVAKEDREEFRKVLDALLREGKVQVTAKGKYIKPDERLLTGTFIGNAKGFGFVEIEGREEDLYVPESMVNNAFHLDRVQVELLPGKRGKRQEAAVRKVLEHGARQIVGTYEQSASFGFVIPDDGKIGTDIFVPKERSKGAVDGHKVVVELTSYGDERHKPEGKIVEILGHIHDPGVDILSIIRGYDLPEAFGEKVMNQAERIPDTVSEADMAGRTDLRDVQMVTIDGEDAKDLDDAVSLSKEGEWYHLGVHIADVSNYVQENSALGGIGAGNERLSCGQGHSHAAAQAVERYLLSESGRGQAGAQLPDDDRYEGKRNGLSDRRERHTRGQADVVYECQKDSGRSR